MLRIFLDAIHLPLSFHIGFDSIKNISKLGQSLQIFVSFFDSGLSCVFVIWYKSIHNAYNKKVVIKFKVSN